MANTGFKGVDVRQTGNQLVFRVSLKDSAGAKLATGTTTIAILELQSDGTFKTYDFSSNTFKTSGMTSSNSTASMTHRTRITDADASVNLGIWTYVLSTLTGFTAGGVYIAQVSNSGASPADQEREFQYGSAEGDLVVTANGTGVGELNADLKFWLGVAPLALSSQLVQVLDSSGIGTLLTRLTATRAGYIDNLSAGAVATSDEVLAIQNNTTTSLIAPANILRPAAGTLTCYIRVYLTDEVGNMEAPDSAPTLDVRNAAGTDLTARLGSTTGTLEATGQYRWVYTSTAGDSAEQILFEVTVVENTLTRKKGVTSWITDNASTDFTAADRTKLEAAYNKLPSGNIADQTSAAAAATSAASVDTKLTTTRAGYLDNLSAGAVSTAANLALAKADTAAIKVVTDKIASGIEADGLVYRFTTNMLEQAPSGDTAVTITPITSTLGNGETVSDSGRLVAYQHRRFGPFQITVVDANGDPVDLSGDNLVLVATPALSTDGATQFFQITQASGDITVGGASNNVMTIDADDTATGTAGDFTWTITDIITDTVRARGNYPPSQIKVAANVLP